MTVVFSILIGLAMLLTLGVLFAGLIGMARGGPDSGARSNRLMRLRVICQGIAFLLFGIAMLVRPD